MPNIRPAAALALVIALGLAGCGGSEQAPGSFPDPVGPPDLLLLTIDTLRSDRVGCLGHPGGLTPSIDRLLRRGVIARNAFAPAPLTAVSHASILTGLEPPSHGVRENGSFPLPAAGFPTLAETLRDAGFRTAAFIAALPLSSRLGFARGFDRFDEELRLPENRVRFFAERPAADVVDAVLAWLDAGPTDERWFVWAHFFDPHQPRTVPAPLRRLPAADAYDREIRGMDFEIRRLLREITERGGGRAPITAIVSDHGEALGDHRESSHGILLHRETMEGLLGFVAPAGTAEAARLGTGLRLAPSRYSDVLPTMLDLAGVGIPGDVEGDSWVDASARPRGVYGESYYPMIHYGWSPLLSWRDERWTYLSGPSPELFDRASDPAEVRDVIADHPDVAADFAARVAAAASDPIAPEDALDDETKEQLLALGYVSGPGQAVDRGKDPKRLIGAVNLLTEGTALLAENDFDGALKSLQGAYRIDPDNATILTQLAKCLWGQGDALTATSYFRRAVDLNPRATEAWAHLARLTFGRGDVAAAFDQLAEALRLNPGSVSLLIAEGDLRQRRGELDEAERRYREAADVSPLNSDPWLALARLAEARGDEEGAARAWRHIATEWPWHPGIPDANRTEPR